MQKILIILFFVLIPSSVITEEINYYVSLKYNKVHVRYGPSSNSPIKYIYKKKYLPLKVIDKKEHFRKIIDLKKNSGWIHKSQLIKSKSLISAKIDLSTNSLFSKFVNSTSAAAKSVFAPIILRPGINVSFMPFVKSFFS